MTKKTTTADEYKQQARKAKSPKPPKQKPQYPKPNTYKIIAALLHSTHTQKELAQHYHVSRQAISQIHQHCLQHGIITKPNQKPIKP